jgi:ABC-type bacteriocin/lantibiotic exporter with double-glycine peptidase domain
MDSLYRGPLNSGMQNLVSGMVSIRAYERVHYFRQKFVHLVEKTANATFTYYTVSRVMSFYLDLMVVTTTACITASVIFIYRGKVEAAQLAFAMQIITDVIAYFSVCLRFIADLMNMFTGSQRIHRYCQLESEDELVKESDYALMGEAQLAKHKALTNTSGILNKI